jgi:hypothetical protein
MVPPRHQKEIKQKLKEAKIPYEIEILDLQKAINNENPIVNVSSATNRNTGITNTCTNILKVRRITVCYSLIAYDMSWTHYHRLNEIYDYLSYLADTYPCLVQLINIGTSYEGRPLYVVHISNSTSAHTPAIWIDGSNANICL